jgi:nitrite reductase/ring-hydroxylating ferredoxin subunit
MTVTGDWTMVTGDGGGGGGCDPSLETTEAPTTDALPTEPRKTNALRFPCLEQPPRFALRSSSGRQQQQQFYLGGTKRGQLVGRTKRTENDEWTIAFAGPDAAAHSARDGSNSHSGATSTVVIHNHKFGNALSLVPCNKSDMGRTVACVSPKQQQKEQQQKEEQQKEQQQAPAIPHDLGLGEKDTNKNVVQTEEEETTQEQLPDDEDQDEDEDQEDMQWCVIRCSEDDCPNGGVTIISLKTGDSLGMSEKGKVILVAPNDERVHVWQMECVTGELCFLSNPTIDARVRCDMTGLLTLSPNWKGWEVVRITEVAAPYSSGSNSGGESGYVRISSWMHSQWFLCSDSTGSVSACHVTDSLLTATNNDNSSNDDSNSNENEHNKNNNRCSKWAIEKYPTDEGNKHEGVVIRSVTHGRLLSIRDGVLRTYDSLEGIQSLTTPTNPESNNNSNSNDEESANDTITASTNAGGDQNNIGEMVKHHTDEMKRKSSQWWKQSLTNVQKTLSDSAIQRRNSKMLAAGETPVGMSPSLPGSVRQEDTIVWQLEAAHLQTYYFISTTASSSETDNGEIDSETEYIPTPPRSIGAFPSVTENLRKSDKIQLVRNDKTSPDTLKLYLPDEKFFVTCSSKGSVFATKNNQGEDEEGTEWILEERSDGSSVFRSKAHGLYLSLRDEDTKTPPAAAFAAATAAEEEEIIGQEGASSEAGSNANANSNANSNANDSTSPRNKLKNPFENLKLPHQKPKAPIAELCATETPMTFWNLEPCTPRAISSKRIKTFAIGTTIAVGTTIAMPFALAGVAAAMGALGAEAGIGFGIVAAAATGAEALASVGAIGATAYFCFRPEKNSLVDDIEDSDGSSNNNNNNNNTNPWLKRPFSNWRNW